MQKICAFMQCNEAYFKLFAKMFGDYKNKSYLCSGLFLPALCRVDISWINLSSSVKNTID